MNEIIREHTLRALTVQRNVFLAIVFFLIILTLVLSFLLFIKSERTIVVPAVVEKEFWVEGSSVSPSYLEQMGCFLGDLLLTRSPASADMQLTILMRQTAPVFSHLLSIKLSEELVKLKKDNASYVFFKTNVIVDPQKQTVTLEGDRSLFLGDKVLSTEHECYRLCFVNFGGRLLLSSIERKEI
jgi:conjugal transfer pilus assembly protein TraE